jgi:hypothetical protein
LIGFASCRKEENSGGKVIEGTINLEVHAVHHALDVPAIMIYLKRNATQFPGNDSSVYTYSRKTDGYGMCSFEKLFPGNYYVYASGYDSLWHSNVTGNIPVVLDQSTINNNEASITVEVSE